jgi:rhodanese-related sulfurtransferase
VSELLRPSFPRARSIVALLTVGLSAATGCHDLQARTLGVDEISPQQLATRLAASERPLLLDTRDAAAYRAGHLAGSLSLTPTQAARYVAHSGPSPKRLVVAICYEGRASLTVAAMVAGAGHERVVSLRGGVEAWRAAGLALVQGQAPPIAPALLSPRRLPTTVVEQLASVISGLVVKPIYMLLTLLLIIALWRSESYDLRLLLKAMIAFEIGETFCALNFLTSGHANDVMEILHGLGMVVMGAYLSWGLFELIDGRVLRFSDPSAGCAFSRFCRRCWKREPVSCGLQRLFLFLAPTLALMSLLPLSAPLRPLEVATPVFGTDVFVHKTMLRQVVEFRVYPLLAALLFLVTTIRLLGGAKGMRAAHGPFFWGIGLFAFSTLRFTLLAAYREMPIWGDWWEELTELGAVGMVLMLLWAFRGQLGVFAWVPRWGRPADPPATKSEG